LKKGTLLVDVHGSVVGQVNGLAVYQLGDFSFGKPSRITVKTFMGRGGIINIERESKLSGKSHDKGVLILAGYVGSQFAQSRRCRCPPAFASSNLTTASMATAHHQRSCMQFVPALPKFPLNKASV
jgi:hypothetical protein